MIETFNRTIIFGIAASLTMPVIATAAHRELTTRISHTCPVGPPECIQTLEADDLTSKDNGNWLALDGFSYSDNTNFEINSYSQHDSTITPDSISYVALNGADWNQWEAGSSADTSMKNVLVVSLDVDQKTTYEINFNCICDQWSTTTATLNGEPLSTGDITLEPGEYSLRVGVRSFRQFDAPGDSIYALMYFTMAAE